MGVLARNAGSKGQNHEIHMSLSDSASFRFSWTSGILKLTEIEREFQVQVARDVQNML
jgi:hypothetical protein